MHDKQSAAGELFAGGFNCAQSILAAFAGQSGVAPELALRMAAPFGGGMGRKGEVCGALIGALMVLGLRSSTPGLEGREEMYRITREFMAAFEQLHGNILCRQLVGHDIATSEGLQAARDAKVFSTICPAIVADTAMALASFIQNQPASD